MRRACVLAAIGLLVSILVVPGVLADVNDKWEWKDSVRKITYSFDMLSDEDKKAVEDSDSCLKEDSLTELSNQWKNWVDAAAAKWNTALAAEPKKWELVKVADNGMIRVVSGDWSDGTLGQLFNWGYECTNGREMWERGVIVMNTPLSTWSTTDSVEFEPVRTVMHEFGHVLCLDHKNTITSDTMFAYSCESSTATTVACGARQTPLRSTTLSAKDIVNAKGSAKNKRTCDVPGAGFGPRSLSPGLGHRIVTGVLHFNMSQAPFNDVRVRRSICYCIDRNELTDVLDLGYPLFSPIPFPLLGVPSLSRVTDEGLLYDQDVQKARQLLADAGYPNGLSIEVVIPYNSDLHQQVMLVIQHQLRQCNIEVTVAVVPPVSFSTQAQAGGMPMLLILSPVLSGEEIFSQYHTFSVGLGMSQFEELNQLIVAGQSASTGLERAEIWEEAQIHLLREVPAYPLFVTLD